MEKPTIPTLPVRQVIRKKIFAMRLTEKESAEIQALGKQLKLPDSYVARHFILEGGMSDAQKTETPGTAH